MREEDAYFGPEEEEKEGEGDGEGGGASPLPPKIDVERLTSPDEPFRPERMKQLFNRHGFNLVIGFFSVMVVPFFSALQCIIIIPGRVPRRARSRGARGLQPALGA